MSNLKKYSQIIIIDSGEPWIVLFANALSKYNPTQILQLIQRGHAWMNILSKESTIFPRGILSHKTFLSVCLLPFTILKVSRVFPHDSLTIITNPRQWNLAVSLSILRRTFIYHACDEFVGKENYGSPKWMEALIIRFSKLNLVVSKKLENIFVSNYNVNQSDILVLPNAIPDSWLYRYQKEKDCANIKCENSSKIAIKRLKVGIIGNITKRYDFDAIYLIATDFPELDFHFYGAISLEGEHPILDRIRALNNCIFHGSKPFDDLYCAFKEIDLALIPYSSGGINPASSPVRLYCHLLFGQPIITLGDCAEFSEFESVIYKCDNTSVAVMKLKTLVELNGDDGLFDKRHECSRSHLWSKRIHALLENRFFKSLNPN